ncbi:uncharacterized protein BN706_01029 [Clostridium sp. CAG:557]|jgi:glucan phosphoethanolaminetransferase (alkaline phosphatase superfamily)|nr:uncharacterized protein BN706_01029 [Clostridium sp. CAG:557]
MNKNQLKCPYCRQKISFMRAFQSKTNEEFFCENCNNFSKLMVNSALKSFAMVLAVLVGLVCTVFTFFLRFYILGTSLIILLFFAFYLQVPRFIVLKKKNDE